MEHDWKEKQEPEKEEKEEESYSFLQETIKDEQKKPGKIVGGLFRTAVKGLVLVWLHAWRLQCADHGQNLHL